jgi:ParB family chromosome partitioning protein
LPSEQHEGIYEIVSGERRYRAALLVGLKIAPCIILHDSKKAEEIAIIENIQRENLHPVELMRAYRSLLEHKICHSAQEVANKVGVAKSSIIDILNIRNLSEETQESLVQNKIINRDFFRLLCKTSHDEQFELVKQYVKTQQVNRKKQNSPKKTRIMSLVLLDGDVSIDENKLNKLSLEQKNNVVNVLQKIIQNI